MRYLLVLVLVAAAAVSCVRHVDLEPVEPVPDAFPIPDAGFFDALDGDASSSADAAVDATVDAL